jgi:4-hydroxythreonine-4-phosphate dehydrogenase
MHMPPLPCLALSTGEPAGIGPDLALMLAQQPLPCRLLVLADRTILRARAQQMGLNVHLHEGPQSAGVPPHAIGQLCIRHIPAAAAATAGQLDPRNAPHVLALLDEAVRGCLLREYQALVTAPVHKGILNDAGYAFSGHTEYLAEKCGVPRVVMMLAGGGLRVALATTHLPLARVSAALTPPLLRDVIRILDKDLRDKFGIARPRILIAGLNPHAGEGGHLGREEIDILIPVIDALRAEGLDLEGPLPADTLFARIRTNPCDAVLAMYHDQGLPVLKYASFGAGVNITLGLPMIRTSVDHGTALGLAGSGRADVGSLLTAIDTAISMANAH